MFRAGNKTGVESGSVVMSYSSIFKDVRTAMDHVHLQVWNFANFLSIAFKDFLRKPLRGMQQSQVDNSERFAEERNRV